MCSGSNGCKSMNMRRLNQRPSGPMTGQQLHRGLPRHILRSLGARPLSTSTARSYTMPVDSAPPTLPTQHRLAAPTVQAMDCLAALFASHIRPGDCYCLYGAVGAGKSVFSRAFIRAVAEDDFLPVPSPTFLLQNTYDEHRGPPIHHFDFYRLSSLQDFNRLDIEGSLARAVCLMEWPERLPSLPVQCLAVQIEVVDDTIAEMKVTTSSSALTSTVASTSLPGSPRRSRSSTPSRGRAFAVDGSYDSDSETTYIDDFSPTCTPEEVDTEADADDFTDQRPRLVTLTPYGSYWEGRARRIISYIAAHSYACDGLVVLDDPSAAAASQDSSAAATTAPFGTVGSSDSL